MTKQTRQWVATAVLFLLTAVIVLFLRSQPELLQSLQNVTFANLFYLTLIRVFIFAMNGLFLREFAAKFGVKLSFHEWFGLASVTTMGNYITPFSGGLLIRAAYLKKRHQLPYTQFTTMLTSNYLIMFWLIGVLGLLALAALGQGWQRYWPIVLLFGSVVAGISVVFLFPVQQVPWQNRIGRFLNTLLTGWFMVKRDYGLLLRLALLTALTIGLNGLSFWLAYEALGQPISYLAALLLGLVAAFSIFINLTPGNLGIQEAMVGLSAELLGTGGGEGLLAVMLIRAVTVLCAFTLGPLYSYLLTRQSVLQE